MIMILLLIMDSNDSDNSDNSDGYNDDGNVDDGNVDDIEYLLETANILTSIEPNRTITIITTIS